MKRFLDIIVSLLALVVLSPIGLVVGTILKLTGEGEVFFVHSRIGRNGKRFGLIKFATMLKDSPNLGTGDITVRNDPRVLPFGRFIRKTKINELPQIINVLKGDMSIIGPRPLTRKNFDYYSDEVKQIIYRMRPGLSGIGSIIFRDEEVMMADLDMTCHEFYEQYIAPYKAELEVWYHRNRSLWVDVVLVFLTAWVIIFPKTNLPFRLLSSLPPRPPFLMDETYRKDRSRPVSEIEDGQEIVEFGRTLREAGQSNVLR